MMLSGLARANTYVLHGERSHEDLVVLRGSLRLLVIDVLEALEKAAYMTPF